MMAAAAKQPEVMPVKKEEGEHPMSGMMKNMMKQKGPDAKTGGMQVNKGTGGNPDMSAMMKAMMGKKAKEYSKEEVNKALAIMEVERTLKNVISGHYRKVRMVSCSR